MTRIRRAAGKKGHFKWPPAPAADGGLYLIPDNKACLCPWIKR